jgi:hypothetical protein
MIEHLRNRRLVSLLAWGALSGEERARAERHVAACPRCARELALLQALRAELEADPLRAAEPMVPVAHLAARVRARLEAPPSAPRLDYARRFVTLAAAAAAVVALLAVALPRLVERPPAPSAREAPEVSAEALARLERTVAREQTARYLSEAQDVLVSVAATAPDCDKAEGRVEMGDASERSRALLARRALLVESDRAEVASARPVLNEVEEALREVAALPSCVRAAEVDRLRAHVERRQLLMRIRLMTRELEG